MFAILVCAASLTLAQEEAEPPAVVEEEKKLTPEEMAAKAAADAKAAAALKKIQEEALAELLDGATELTPEQVANFEKWLPHTYKRLKRRLPVHIATIGDSLTRYRSHDDNRDNSHFSFHGVFAAKLAHEFFYPGGVRDIMPRKPEWSKLDQAIGDEITLENLGMNGRVSLHALSRITTDGLVNQPDLVMINFGINDALLGVGLATYIEALERSVRYVKSTGADVILLGPSVSLRNGSAHDIGVTRTYSGAMEELAARLGVFFFDLGRVTTNASGTPPGKEPAEAFTQIVAACKSAYFDHGPEIDDGLHPDSGAHQQMGAALLDALRDGRPADPYRIKGFVTLGAGGTAALEFKVKNMQEQPAKGQLLLLPVSGLKPEVAGLPFELGAGKGQVFKVNYKSASGLFDLPAIGPRVFVPMLVTDAEQSYSPVFGAAVTPVGVVWDVGAEDLNRSRFEVKCDLVATGAAAASGSYEASWNGQVTSGKFNLQPGARETLALPFEVPAASGKFSVRDNLVLAVNTGGNTIKFVRRLEASRHIALGEKIPLMNPDRYIAGESARGDRVLFSAEASASQLVLHFDADNLPLEGDDQLAPLILEFQLDARAYGKRRKFGYVDIVRVKFDPAGNPEPLKALRPAVFGDWYNRALDNTKIIARRTMLPNGRARYSVTIPRSYLYMHEFSIGNSSSLLGVNVELYFAKANQPDNPYPSDRHFTLIESGLNNHAAESLAVLELVSRPTGRWSVRLH